MASMEKITIKRVDRQKILKAQLSQRAAVVAEMNGRGFEGIRFRGSEVGLVCL